MAISQPRPDTRALPARALELADPEHATFAAFGLRATALR